MDHFNGIAANNGKINLPADQKETETMMEEDKEEEEELLGWLRNCALLMHWNEYSGLWIWNGFVRDSGKVIQANTLMAFSKNMANEGVIPI